MISPGEHRAKMKGIVTAEAIGQRIQHCRLIPALPRARSVAFPCHRYSARCRPERLRRTANGFLDRLFGGEPSLHQDGPELVPLDVGEGGGLGGTSEGLFGPLAVLLVGFAQYEVDDFRAFMNDMEADMVKIITCTRKLLACSLEEALNSPATTYEPLSLGTRRAVVLSGMCSAEVREVIGAYADSGLPEALWAAAVPANYQRRVSTLLEDIQGDHSVMVQRERDAALRRGQAYGQQ